MTDKQFVALVGAATIVAALLVFRFCTFNGGCVDKYVSLGTDPAYAAKVCKVQP